MRWAFSAAFFLCAGPVWAGQADVIAATAQMDASGTWSISATIRHADTGWDHYADRFDVLDEAGDVLGSRTLFHPHVDEQPFTRSLNGLAIPQGVDSITVRAHDSVHGLGGATIDLILER